MNIDQDLINLKKQNDKAYVWTTIIIIVMLFISYVIFLNKGYKGIDAINNVVTYTILIVMVPIGYIYTFTRATRITRLIKIGIKIKAKIDEVYSTSIRNSNYWTLNCVWIGDKRLGANIIDGQKYIFKSTGYRFDPKQLIGLMVDVWIDPQDPNIYIVNDLQIPKFLPERALESVNFRL